MMNNQILKNDSLTPVVEQSVFRRLQEQLSLQHPTAPSQQKYSKDGIHIVSFKNKHFKKGRTKLCWNSNYIKPPFWKKNNYPSNIIDYDHAVIDDENSDTPSDNKFDLTMSELGVHKALNFDDHILNHSSVAVKYQPYTFSSLAHKRPFWHHKQDSQVKYSKDGILVIGLQKNAFKKGRKKSYWNKENINCLSISERIFGSPSLFCNAYQTKECSNDTNPYISHTGKTYNFDLKTNIEGQQMYKQPNLHKNLYDNQSLDTQNQVSATSFTCDVSSRNVNEREPDVIFEKMVSAEEKRVLAVITIAPDTESGDNSSYGNIPVTNCDSSQMASHDLGLQTECQGKKKETTTHLKSVVPEKEKVTTISLCNRNYSNPQMNVETRKTHCDNPESNALNFLPPMQVAFSSSKRSPNVGCVLTTVGNEDHILDQRAESLKGILGFYPPKLHLLGLHPSWENQQKLRTIGCDVKKGRYMEDEDFILLENLKLLQQDFHLDLYDTLLGNRRRKYIQNLFSDTHFFLRLGRNLNNRTLYSAYKRAGGLLLIHQKIEELKVEFRKMNFSGKKGVGKKIEMQNTKSRGTWNNAEIIQLLKAMDMLTHKRKVEFTQENSFWDEIAKLVPSRSAKQCKSRWFQFHKFNFKVI